ncbi:hypothetical protein DRP07_12640 [Archaeoglobales archaeon]|nr:MAG: hypothetical protein DRP07_12640 [Archaeoglobales archaeon]
MLYYFKEEIGMGGKVDIIEGKAVRKLQEVKPGCLFVYLPVGWCRKHNLSGKSQVELYIRNNEITLKPINEEEVN